MGNPTGDVGGEPQSSVVVDSENVHHVTQRDFAAEASQVFPVATTALPKDDGRHFGRAVDKVCAPFQFALSTRAGTD